MDFEELVRNIQQIWDKKPGIIVLLLLGAVVFVFLVVDAWRHKHRHRKRRH